MKLAICVLALATVALSQAPSVTFNDALSGMGNLGYPNRAYGLTKSGASFAGAFHVPNDALRPALPVGGRVCMKLILKPDNINSRTATMEVFTRQYSGAGPSAAPVPTTSDRIVIRMTTQTASQTVYSGIVSLADNGTYYDGIAVGGYLTACSGCLRTADFIITAVLGTSATNDCPTTGAGITWANFPVIHDKATWEFDAAPATGYQNAASGPAGGKFVKATAQDIYLLAIPADSGKSLALALHNANTPNPPPAPSSFDNNNGPDKYVLPLGSISRSGNIRSGRIPNVAAGTWWVSPYVNTGSTWSFAVGFGSEPAAAGMLVPSMLLAAILAIVAMLL